MSRWHERALRLMEEGEPEAAPLPPAPAVQPGDVQTLDGSPSFQDRPADWTPEPGPGVTISAPAIEVDAQEYDSHLEKMMRGLPEGSVERNRLAYAARKGSVMDRGSGRIFTRGRT